jgi:cobalt-zinc-cadmium efflux system protein
MAAHHHHAHNLDVSRKLIVAASITTLVVIAEIAAGIYAGSLALVGDALHNLTDAVALLIALAAVRLERRAATHSKSFGYQRAGILAAFINAAMLATLTILVFREAYVRLRHVEAVQTTPMLIVGSITLLVNGVIAFSLHKESRDDLNIRGAFVHMIGDAVSSAGIIVAAILIIATGASEWDAIISIFIGVLILWSSYGVLTESMNLLLEGTPSGIDPEAVTRALGTVDGIQGVHHLHIWALGPSSPALSCHLMVGDVPVSTTAKLLEQINELLAHEFAIAHTTVQFEFAECAEGDPHCVRFG